MTIDPSWMAAPEHGGPPRDKGKRRLIPKTFAQFSECPDPQFLIPQFIPEQSLGSLIAKSGAYKTWLLELVARTGAMGGDWNGKPVQKFATCYFATENPGSFKRRVKLGRKRSGFDGFDAFAFDESIDLMAANCFLEMSDAIKAAQEQTDLAVKLVVIDTLRDSWGGDENSSTETARAMATMKKLRDQCDVSVIFAHHCGHEGSRARGSYNLYANVDFEWTAEISGDVATARCTKMRDGECNLSFSYRLEDEGEPGLVFVDAPASAAKSRERALSGQKRIAYDALQDVTAGEQGEPLPASLGLPHGLYGVRCEAWRQAFYDKLGDIKPNSKLIAFNRALQELSAMGLVGVHDPYAWPIRKDAA